MSNDGWIKLHRKVKDNILYPSNREFTKFEAWIDLLLLVNHADKEILIKNEVITCLRGQSVMSFDGYQRRWGWTLQKVRSFFNLLQKQQMVTKESNTKTTWITVCKYEIYQVEQQTDNKPITNEQQTDNKPITTNKNDKNDKNYKKILLSEISISDFPEINQNYFEIAKSFKNLFIKNLTEAGASTGTVDKAKGTWVDDIRQMVETDNYSIEDLRAVYNFLQNDAFWKQNILSTSKLREQMPKLKLKIHNGENKSNSKTPPRDTNELAEIIYKHVNS